VVLAARLGGLEDALVDGTTGFFLPPADPAAWAEAIVRIAGWPAEDRAAFCRKAAQEVGRHFSWDRVARETLGAYRQASA
jgi:glycosyltransferase involved in cell wall biosynthesis